MKPGEPITLNFVNADIEAVARAMATLSGRNVVVDPRVKGQINLGTERAVSPAVALKETRIVDELAAIAWTPTWRGRAPPGRAGAHPHRLHARRPVPVTLRFCRRRPSG